MESRGVIVVIVSYINMPFVKMIKNPNGSLCRAAALHSALLKKRREVREEKTRGGCLRILIVLRKI
ncbi:conserved hypothetical protein [Ricinus communis]|uniref:Uncharacterized protein n=1 Tax=Ricinus communis TaxID=3988 RepID=B9T397_RICCO|nr:conserved hypothetical protein [Ricinus communis]